MKLKRLCSVALAATMAITAFTTVDAVGAPYSEPKALISAAIDSTLSGIDSTSLSTAVETVNGYFTNASSVVSYKGATVGYWENDTLYADAEHTKVLIQDLGDSGFKWSPDFLETVLTDVNDNIVESYVPTTGDWTKIIGKYDIKLGSTAIPADQWIPMDIKSEDSWNDLEDVYKFTEKTGIKGTDLSGNTHHLMLKAYVVDGNGDLYLTNGVFCLYNGGYGGGLYYLDVGSLDSKKIVHATVGYDNILGVESDRLANTPYIRLKLVQGGEGREKYLQPAVLTTDIGNTRAAGYIQPEKWETFGMKYFELRKLSEPSVVYEGDLSDIKTSGICWTWGEEANYNTYSGNIVAVNVNMFESYSCAKTSRGNRLLTNRINKLANLDDDMFIRTNTSGWYMTDNTNFDNYIGTQDILNAGDTADINAVAEVEPMCFNVIVPTSLPIYVDSLGVVSVADNASITNKSNSGVKLTAIDISAKAESGWTLVGSNPSLTRDAKEFTFTTSLAVGDVLDRNETKRFTYNAELSPITEGADSLDLATVAVTVDWAD